VFETDISALLNYSLVATLKLDEGIVIIGVLAMKHHHAWAFM
jgi:hypothetical protein